MIVTTRRVLGLFAVVLFLGAAAVAWHQRPRSIAYYSDGDAIRRSVDAAQPRNILWQPPTSPVGVRPISEHDYEPRMSRDGQTLYLVRGKADGNADIYISHRSHKGWSEPASLDAINSTSDDLGPYPSLDDQSLYFYSNREGGLGGFDIWVSRRDGDAWAPPINLGQAVNSTFNDYGPALSPSGDILYFASNRPQEDDTDRPNPDAWPATIREEFHRRDYDLFSSTLTDQGFADATSLDALNTPRNEGSPALSPFGDFLYFASDRPGGEGGYDLYRARILYGDIQSAETLGDTINTPDDELDPALTLGGFELFFSSNRPVLAERSGGSGDVDSLEQSAAVDHHYHIYHSTSREVFVDTEIQQARFDWGRFFGAIGPNLFWILLVLLLLLGLLALLKKSRDKEMSLLMRCLLASIFAHLVLIMILNLWGVTSALGDLLANKGVRVAIISPSIGNAMVSQVQGSVIEYQAPTAEIAPTQRRKPQVTLPISNAQPMTTTVARTSLPDQPSVVENRPTSGAIPRSRRFATPAPMLQPNDPPLPIQLASDNKPVAHSETTLSVPDQPVENARRSANSIQSGAPPRVETIAIAPAHVAHQPVETSVAINSRLRPASATPQQVPRRIPELTPAATNEQRNDLEIALPDSRALPKQAEGEQILAVTAPAPRNIERAGDHPLPMLNNAPSAVNMKPEANTQPISRHTAISNPPHLRRSTGSPSRRIDTALRVDAQPGGTAMALPQLETAASPTQSSREQEGPVPMSPPRPSASRIAPTLSMHGAITGRAQSAMVALPTNRSEPASQPLKPTANQWQTPSTSNTPTRLAAKDIRLTDLTPSTPIALDLSLPTEVAPIENPYQQRAAEERAEFLERLGGGDDTEKAVSAALDWLARHQSPEGLWDGDQFDDRCGQCSGSTQIAADIAITGLSVLCFLGADHHHEKDGPYRKNIDRALTWLLKQQDERGALLGDETMYSHGIATIALSEAYGMSKDPRLKAPVTRAVRFIENARNQKIGGWRYDPGQVGDTSVLGWQVMALCSAKLAGVDVSDDSFEAAKAWLNLVSTERSPGLYGYQPRRQPTPSMTAEGMFVQQLLGRSREDARMAQSAAHVLKETPDWQNGANTYYWYYATLAMYQHGGESWTEWNEHLKAALLPNQENGGPAAGSWPTQGKWADRGGRVYQTALCTLMLEVYYRYLPLYNISPTPAMPAQDGSPLGSVASGD